MPYLIFSDDPNTKHLLRGLDTAPPRAIIAMQHETGWSLKEIRDQAKSADYYGAVISAYLTAQTARRPIEWETLLDKPASDCGYSIEPTAEERRKADEQARREAAGEPEPSDGDVQDPPQPSPPASDPEGEHQAEAQ